LEIFWAVVRLVGIDVMNNLGVVERLTEELLGYKAAALYIPSGGASQVVVF